MAYRWDPYPFILLNLVFSTQAAYAAPLILLSQNRQADTDRITAEHDYRVNQFALQHPIAWHRDSHGPDELRTPPRPRWQTTSPRITLVDQLALVKSTVD